MKRRAKSREHVCNDLVFERRWGKNHVAPMSRGAVGKNSMNDRRPDPLWREITPHAFGWDGFRWHVRAFCHMELTFKDFIISRCLAMGELGDPKGRAEEDINWN